MRSFMFPGGLVWTLQEANGVGLAELPGGGVGALLFSDKDLAESYADGTSKMAKSFPLTAWPSFRARMKELGVTHVIVDHSQGKAAHSTEIDSVILQ